MQERGALPPLKAEHASRVSELRRQYRWALAVAVVVVAADQLTKLWAVDALADRTITLAGPTRLALSHNTGGAFGLGAGALLVELILTEKTHPEQGFRACVGILRLAKSYGAERLEAACTRALEIGARSYTSVSSILKTNRDRQRPATATDEPAIVHSNIRGPRYFN